MYRPQQKLRPSERNAFGCGCMTAMLLGIVMLYSLTDHYGHPTPAPPHRPATSSSPSRSSGSTVSTCIMSPSAEVYRRATDAAVHGNGMGMAAMGVVILESGTRVRVLGSAGFMLKRVAVLSGPYAGRSGVVAAEKIR